MSGYGYEKRPDGGRPPDLRARAVPPLSASGASAGAPAQPGPSGIPVDGVPRTTAPPRVMPRRVTTAARVVNQLLEGVDTPASATAPLVPYVPQRFPLPDGYGIAVLRHAADTGITVGINRDDLDGTVAGRIVVRSTDGRSWAGVPVPSDCWGFWSDLDYSPTLDLWVAVRREDGSPGVATLMASADGGLTWTAVSFGDFWSTVRWSSNGYFLLGGDDGAATPVIAQYDGTTLTPLAASGLTFVPSVLRFAEVYGRWYAARASNGRTIAYSDDDGATWTTADLFPDGASDLEPESLFVLGSVVGIGECPRFAPGCAISLDGETFTQYAGGSFAKADASAVAGALGYVDIGGGLTATQFLPFPQPQPVAGEVDVGAGIPVGWGNTDAFAYHDALEAWLFVIYDEASDAQEVLAIRVLPVVPEM